MTGYFRLLTEEERQELGILEPKDRKPRSLDLAILRRMAERRNQYWEDEDE